jgi:hypothetical protein
MVKVAKQAYEAPALSVVGTFESITQSTGVGSKLDAAFPSGTPFNELTFS